VPKLDEVARLLTKTRHVADRIAEHEATQFDRVQEIIRRPEKPRRHRNVFAYTGLVRCGECGSQITAEIQKTHTYYHCTHRCSRYSCTQPYLRSEKLDAQAEALIEKAAAHPTFHEYLAQLLSTEEDVLRRERAVELAMLEVERETLTKAVETLLALHLRGIVAEQMFLEEHARLLAEMKRVVDRIADPQMQPTEPAILETDVVARFAAASPQTKHSVLRAIATDLVLYENKLSFRLVPPPEN
jgi:site-specific DNA recombinase